MNTPVSRFRDLIPFILVALVDRIFNQTRSSKNVSVKISYVSIYPVIPGIPLTLIGFSEREDLELKNKFYWERYKINYFRTIFAYQFALDHNRRICMVILKHPRFGPETTDTGTVLLYHRKLY